MYFPATLTPIIGMEKAGTNNNNPAKETAKVRLTGSTFREKNVRPQQGHNADSPEVNFGNLAKESQCLQAINSFTSSKLLKNYSINDGS